MPYQHMFLLGGERIYHFGRGRAYLGIFCTLVPGSSMQPQSMVPVGAWNTPSGLVGIPIARRVFRSDAAVMGTPPQNDCFSLYGKAMPWSPTTHWARHPGRPRGHSMSLGLCPTKLPVAWEERTDHPLVPATGQAPVLTRLAKARPLSWQD